MPRNDAAPPITAGQPARPVPIYGSSVGQKMLVGATGLFLCSFLVIHLSGNLTLFRNDHGRAFDAYTELMSASPAIRALEIVLAAGFLIHIILAVKAWAVNRMSRPGRYASNRPSENSALESRLTFVTGSVIFVFLVVHLRTFFVPARFGSGIKPSMYQLVREAFASPFYDAFYLIALALLAFHLKHGFQAAFQTFGLRPGRERLLEAVAAIFWLLIPLGFASMPVYFYWLHANGGY